MNVQLVNVLLGVNPEKLTVIGAHPVVCDAMKKADIVLGKTKMERENDVDPHELTAVSVTIYVVSLFGPV